MAETKSCPKCGADIPADAPGGICPKCLMAAGLASDAHSQPVGESPTHTQSGSEFLPPEPESLAAHFPHLEVIELVGKGGMGAVYKARQRELDRLVAIKILPPAVGQGAAFAERFAREARALARLNHQNIVQVYDFGRSGEFFYFIMEFVDGMNLRATIQAGSLTSREALAIVPQICEALQFAHDEGIVHRDIKPENVLIDKRGRVKIADFGLAKLLGRAPAEARLTGTHQVMGTPHYMAPEQTQGSRGVDHRADIYALGVLFYEMLTGELPIGRFEPPSKKVRLDVRLDEVVLRALESEPAKRYQQAGDVKTDVERISGSPQPPGVAAAAFGFPAEPGSENARDQVKWPAIGLLVTGILHCLVFGTILIVMFLAAATAPPRVFPIRGTLRGQPASTVEPPQVQAFSVFGLLSLATLAGTAIGVTMMIGALRMMRLRSYGLAMTAGMIALLPFGPVSVLGIAMGVWSLFVLSRPNVKAAFAIRPARQPANMSVGQG